MTLARLDELRTALGAARKAYHEAREELNVVEKQMHAALWSGDGDALNDEGIAERWQAGASSGEVALAKVALAEEAVEAALREWWAAGCRDEALPAAVAKLADEVQVRALYFLDGGTEPRKSYEIANELTDVRDKLRALALASALVGPAPEKEEKEGARQPFVGPCTCPTPGEVPDEGGDGPCTCCGAKRGEPCRHGAAPRRGGGGGSNAAFHGRSAK
jgi:hypothetical protein